MLIENKDFSNVILMIKFIDDGDIKYKWVKRDVKYKFWGNKKFW